MPDTTTPITVPNDALAKAYDVALDSRSRGLDLGQTSARIMYEAAPLLVAAELRRLAEECGRGVIGTVVLLARANELDPQR